MIETLTATSPTYNATAGENGRLAALQFLKELTRTFIRVACVFLLIFIITAVVEFLFILLLTAVYEIFEASVSYTQLYSNKTRNNQVIEGL